MRARTKDAQILSTIWTRTQEANIWQRLDEQEDVKLCREALVELKDPGFQDPRCRHPLLTQSFQAPHPLSLANWQKSKFNSARNLTLDLPIHAWKLSLFCMEHFHEKGGVGGVPLHVLEIQEILPSLGHRPENTQRSLRISGFLFGFYLSSGIWANSWLYFSWK